MEPMIWVYAGMALLFVFLVILTMDISCARHKIKKLDDIVYGLQTRLWGDWEQNPNDVGEQGKNISELERAHKRCGLNEQAIGAQGAAIEKLNKRGPRKKAQKTVAAKKR